MIVDVKEWIGQEVYIKFTLSEKKFQFFSKGMLERDTLSLKKEIFIVNKSASPDIINDKMMREFSGMDRSGKKSTVRLK
jgi:hypothetical protein